MDYSTKTDELRLDIQTSQENILLHIIKALCTEDESKLSPKLQGKISRIIKENDLKQYTSLNKINITDSNTSSVLGVLHQTNSELSFDDQSELNQAIIKQIEFELPVLITQLENLKQNKMTDRNSRKEQIKTLQINLDDKLNTLHEQENEKVELMMEWLNHRLQDAGKFNKDTGEVLTIKTKILDIKSKILHLNILHNIFTETNQSLKAYNEIHKDLEKSINETKQRIKLYQDIIDNES